MGTMDTLLFIPNYSKNWRGYFLKLEGSLNFQGPGTVLTGFHILLYFPRTRLNLSPQPAESVSA
jgi:hypothetical protein